ncbi:hypothetical protein MKK50_15265 [Methylobacterium sp. J-043]|nr:hypothetical protein [Methylobacterium sp. J-043]
MTTVPTTKTHAIGVGSSEDTMATLVRLRIEREADLQKIFSVLGLSRDQHTADDAVEIIREILLVLTQYESDLSK